MLEKIYADALCETLEYLKGIKEEDIEKIPQNFMDFIKSNASKDYICNFDPKESLVNLKVLPETKAIISMICYSYWCTTDEQKNDFAKLFQLNQKEFEEELSEKYNVNNLFKNNKIDEKNNTLKIDNTNENTSSLIEIRENLFIKIINFFKRLFGKG